MHSSETKKKIGDSLRRSIFFNCFQCGKMAFDKPSSFARKQKHFCSQDCYSSYKLTIPKELHPKYGSGNSPSERSKRRKARSILNHHLRDKKILRPGCETCGNRAEAHHNDYDKPLNVKWLCLKHHRDYHKSIYENPELVK